MLLSNSNITDVDEIISNPFFLRYLGIRYIIKMQYLMESYIPNTIDILK